MKQINNMNEIKIFKNAEFGEIRVTEIDGKPMFVGKDVATILGYAKPTDAIIDHVDSDDCKVLSYKAFAKTEKAFLWQGNDFSDKTLINESGLYSLILSSKLDSAKKFKHWVTSEVLPSIRKTGTYTLPTDYLSALKALVVAEEEKQRLALENEMMKPKAEYFDNLVDRQLLTNFRDTAKEFGIKQNDFINSLLKKGYIYRDKKGNLKPYSQYTPSLFELKDYKSIDGKHVGTQTLITPKGKVTFCMLIKPEFNPF